MAVRASVCLGQVAGVGGFVAAFVFDAALCEPGEVRIAAVGPFRTADLAVEVLTLEFVEGLMKLVGECRGDGSTVPVRCRATCQELDTPALVVGCALSRRVTHVNAVYAEPIDDRRAPLDVLELGDLTENRGAVEASKGFFEVLRRFGAEIDPSTLLRSTAPWDRRGSSPS